MNMVLNSELIIQNRMVKKIINKVRDFDVV